MKLTAVLIGCISLCAAGCYMERPLPDPTPAPSTRVIAQLTDSGTVALSNALGPGALGVEGVVASADAQSWTLQVVRVNHRDGRVIEWNREAVNFPRNLLSQPMVKVLDKKRSWLAAGGIVLGAFILAQTFDLFGSSEDEGEEPPPPASVVPVIPGGGK
ncbi:MAG TPA: hypothetical protein VFZ04_20385 [Longimicrobiales bacterium]